MPDKEKNIETEFLSVSWIFQIFILFLTGIITITIVVILTTVYREEIFQKSRPYKTKKTFSNN